jgi:hypothetical protein
MGGLASFPFSEIGHNTGFIVQVFFTFSLYLELLETED